MYFNFALLREIRLKDNIERGALAELLGVSSDSLYKYESGQREPGTAFIVKLSRYSGIPVGAFLGEDEDLPEIPGKPSGIKTSLELINVANRERFVRKMTEERNSELENLNGHLMSVNELCIRFVRIQSAELTKPEKSKKIASLAREAAIAGEVRFDEIAYILGVSKSILKHWLESSKSLYKCRLFEDRTVIAATPGEAGMRLACFDCEARAKESCRGYGEDNYPENFFALIAMIAANGVCEREEQSKLLREHYDIDLSAHQISELVSRKKLGKSIPDAIKDMKIYKRR